MTEKICSCFESREMPATPRSVASPAAEPVTCNATAVSCHQHGLPIKTAVALSEPFTQFQCVVPGMLQQVHQQRFHGIANFNVTCWYGNEGYAILAHCHTCFAGEDEQLQIQISSKVLIRRCQADVEILVAIRRMGHAGALYVLCSTCNKYAGQAGKQTAHLPLQKAADAVLGVQQHQRIDVSIAGEDPDVDAVELRCSKFTGSTLGMRRMQQLLHLQVAGMASEQQMSNCWSSAGAPVSAAAQTTAGRLGRHPPLPGCPAAGQ